MAFDSTPSIWLGAGYTLAAHVVGFTTSDAGANEILSRLTDAQANATTGDIRQIFSAFCHAMQAAYDTIGAVPANLPTKMVLSAATSTGADGTIRKTFTFRFDLEPAETPVAAE